MSKKPTYEELEQRVRQLEQSESERKRAEKQLQKNEGRFRSLVNDVLDSSAVGVFILDADFKVVWINHALERYFGLRRETVIGQDKRQLIREGIKDIFEAPDSFTERVFATYENNTYIENFICHVLPDGDREERWLEHWSQPIRSGIYSGGRIEHYTDITERKQTEKSLLASERRYQELAESSLDGYIRTNMDGGIVEINKAFLDMLGFTLKEAEQLTNRDITPEKWHKMDEDYIPAILRDGYSPLYQKEYQRKDGTVIPVELRTYVSRDAQARPVGMWAFVRDIRIRRKLENDLRRAIESLFASNQRLLTINRTGLSLQEASEIDDAFKVVKEALKKMKYVPGVIARYQKDGLSIPEAYLTSTQIQGIEEILGIKFEELRLPSEVIDQYNMMELEVPLLFADPANLLTELFPWLGAPGIDRLIQILNLHQLIIAPLKVREKRIGYLAVWSETLQKEDLQSIGVLSQQLAVSIDNLDLIDTIRRQTEELKNLSLKLIQVQEQERRTVSQELHDEVGQALTAVAITLGTIKNDVPTRLPGMFKQRLDEAISITEDVLEQVRELSRSLHPSVLDDLGLTATLNWFVNRYQSAVGIETRLDVINFEETLKPETALAVYRVVQEALTNVARHAQATRVSIMLKKEGSTLMGTIEDNGKGCDQTKGDSTGPSRTWGGVGLVGMRERISLVGGDFSIQFRPGKGTTISFLIPLKEEVA